MSSGLKEIDVILLASSLQKCRIYAKFVFKLPLTHTLAIPHFKEVIVMATNCDACGERTNEVKSGGKLSLNDLQSHVASFPGGASFGGNFSRAFRLTQRLIFCFARNLRNNASLLHVIFSVERVRPYQ